jgi:small-conductance mechanosensitive channel
MFRLMVITLFLGVMVSTGMVSAAEKVPAGEEIQAAGQQETPPQRGVFLSRWLRMLDHGDPGEHGSTGVMAYASKVPGDMTRALQKSGGKRGLAGFVVVLALSLLSISVGYLVVYLARRAFRERISTLNDLEPAGNSSWSKLSVILLQLLPQVAGLFLLGLSSIIFFVPFANFLAATESRMIFQLILGIVLVTRFSTLLAWVVLGADQQSIPLLAVRETVAKPGRTLIWSSVFLLVTPLMIIRFFKELGVQQQTISWLSILLGTLVLFLIGCQLLAMRQPVAQAIRDDGGGQALPLVDYWHLPAVFYLLFCWFVWIGRELTGTALRNGALIASVLIVPFYFVLCYFGKSIIHSIIHSLNLFAEREPAAWERVPSKLETGEDEQAREEKIEELVAKVYSFFRILLAFTLFTWLLNLWGYTIPFAARALEAILESLVVLTLALVSWQYASSYIERKIKEATPEEPEDQENGDDEFGGAAPRGRSHTLLPMLRKVIGTVLMVMVVLIVISSFGVDIGPLLAGAGVVGLAVGFGAQKLVSDVFSGFFFLLDDAFRVGEYIQAGSTKGTVESITLRNVLLRHHLGMLQVVPHSDLGAITNYMRGGIVVRFPLEFTYDTDVDKVRKIIKKVGQAMLDDPELGDDFILPVKSQGVNEIANSVMIIRVKFTAKPGRQFLIRREAYRRITEALNAKGIYYAHRKVIVDFPEDSDKAELSGEARVKALEAGAAAAVTLAAEAEQEQQQQETDR